MLRPSLLFWLLGYVALVVLLVWAMFGVRARMIAQLDTPEAQAEWERWRDDVRAQAEQGGPVQRRVPSSPEPNLLVLLRDHFPMCLATVVFFSSLLYFILVFLARGAWRRE